jgi:mono/diheme cytochrome c family protein
MRMMAMLAMLALAACSRTPAADVAHGKRLATVMGCVSCHGPKLDGHLFEENPAFAIAWSSNLSRILPAWSDAQIDHTLRSGRRPNGSALWFMPTFAQSRLSAADMRDLIAYLRSVPPMGRLNPAIVPGPQWKVALANGFEDAPTQAKRLASKAPVDLGPGTAHGRYLASLVCAECHAPDLTGAREPRPGDPPDLKVAAAYAPAHFTRLLRTGKGLGGRELGWMTTEAQHRLYALTDEEIAQIHAYLTARARH